MGGTDTLPPTRVQASADVADIVFWRSPSVFDKDEFIGEPKPNYSYLPDAFQSFMILTSLDHQVLNGGFSQFLDNRGDEFTLVPKALRAAEMPQLAAACVLAVYDAFSGKSDGYFEMMYDYNSTIVTDFFKQEEDTLADLGAINNPQTDPGWERPNDIYYANQPDDFYPKILDFVRANIDDFVQPSKPEPDVGT